MAPPVKTLPAQYAKFITALGGEAIAYVQLYGATWHLEAALVMAGAALAVLGVPNAAQPAPVQVSPLPQRGGYSAGVTSVKDLPPPPASTPPGTTA